MVAVGEVPEAALKGMDSQGMVHEMWELTPQPRPVQA